MCYPRRLLFCLYSISLLLCLTLSSSVLGAETVSIGFMGPLTGIMAPNGKEMLEGFQFFFKEIGYKIGQREIRLVVEDSEGNPNVALTKLRKLIERDKIKVLAGIQWAHVGYALGPVIDKERLPTIYLTTPDDLTMRKPIKFMTRCNTACSQVTYPLGEYAGKVLGYRRAATIALDNAFGYDSVGGFYQVFRDNGGEVVQKIWFPMNVLDFAAYLSQIKRDVDVVFFASTGGQAIRFIKQYAEYGLKGKIPLLTSGFTTDVSILRQMGDEAVGIISALNWSSTLNNPANRAFVKKFRSAFGKTPSLYHVMMYSAAKWIFEALKATDEKNDTPEKLVALIRKAAQSPGDPRGPIKLDEYNNPIQNIYILRVERREGELQNQVIQTYPMISQFWTYKPIDFLKQPPYSRDFPTLKEE